MPDEVVRDPIFTDPEPRPTPEQEAEWERQRKAEWDAKIAPYRAIKAQNAANTEVIAEHDELVADLMYEMILNEMEV